MKLTDLIRGRLLIPALEARDKRSAIEEIVGFLVRTGAVPEDARPAISKAVHGREDFMSTGMEHGIALPHGVTDRVTEEMAAIGISKEGIPFDSFDGRPAHIIILLLTPTMKALTRVRTLAEIAKVINDPRIRDALVRAPTADEALALIERAERA